MTVTEKIALEVGVCRQSVSAVLNGNKNKVSKDKYARILELAEKFRYQPNPNARSLSGHSVKTIGLIMPVFPSPLSMPLMTALNAEILKREYKCYIQVPTNETEEKDAVAEFIARKVDGIIICSMFSLFNYKHCPLPTVVIGVNAEVAEFSADFAYGIYLAMAHLLRVHGHTNIAFLSDWVSGNQLKYDAYCDFMRNSSLTALPPLETCYCENLEKTVETLIRKKKVTAFVGISDILAGQFINLLNRSGYRVPDDVAVTGYDGTLLCYAAPVQLSAVVHPVRKMAECGVSLLFDKIAAGTLSKNKLERVPPVFFKGQSCGCPGLPLNCNLQIPQIDGLPPYNLQAQQIDGLQEDPKYSEFFEI